MPPEDYAYGGGGSYPTSDYMNVPANAYVRPRLSLSSLDDPVLDEYDTAKNTLDFISEDKRQAEGSHTFWKKQRKAFVDNRLKPLYKEIAGDFYDESLDEAEILTDLEGRRTQDQAISKEEPGWFGFGDKPEVSKEASQRLASVWAKYDSVKRDLDTSIAKENEAESRYLTVAKAYDDASTQWSRVPMALRQALDDQSVLRGKLGPSAAQQNLLMENLQFEEPFYDMFGGLLNRDKVDPRVLHPDMAAAKPSVKQAVLEKQLIQFAANQKNLARDRRFRDTHKLLATINGYQDGYPIGVSRNEVDLLNMEQAKALNLTMYRGKPIEEAFEALGGEERLKVAKVMESVWQAQKAHTKAQLKWASGIRGPNASKLQNNMEATKQAFATIMSEAESLGLGHEILSRAQSEQEWYSIITNPFKRGLLQAELAETTSDLMYNDASEETIQRLSELTKETRDIPTTNPMKRFAEADLKDGWEVLGHLFFDNPQALVGLAVESMSAFIPAYFNTLPEAFGFGAAAGTAAKWKGFNKRTVKGGWKGAKLASTLNWSVASFSLEFTGEIMGELEKMGIDTTNPQMLAAAWSNEHIRKELQIRGYKKALPIALLDGVSAGVAGKIATVVRKPALLLNPLSIKAASKELPRFTWGQRGQNALVEYMADSGLGMTGEAVSDAWVREPGEPVDWKAIMAEGVVGVGPAGVSAVYNLVGPKLPGRLGESFRDFTKAPRNFSEPTDYSVNGVHVGTMGTVDRAGYKEDWRQFDQADSMTAHFGAESELAPDDPKMMMFQDLMARLWKQMPDAMRKVRVVISDRTPSSNPDMPGLFEYDTKTDSYLIYVNNTALNTDPSSTFLHESGHLVKEMLFPQTVKEDGSKTDPIRDLYDSLSKEEQLQHWAQYYLQRDVNYADLTPKEKSEVESSFKKTDLETREHEWFSFQWVRVVAGKTRGLDPDLNKDLSNFQKKFIHPWLERWMGKEGAKTENFDKYLLWTMGYLPTGYADFSNPNVRVPEGGLPKGMEGLAEQEGLNGLLTRLLAQDPKERKHSMKVLKAFLGEEWVESFTKTFLVPGETRVGEKPGEERLWTREEKQELVGRIVSQWETTLAELHPDKSPEELQTMVDGVLSGLLTVAGETEFYGKEAKATPEERAAGITLGDLESGAVLRSLKDRARSEFESKLGPVEDASWEGVSDDIAEFLLINRIEKKLGVTQVREAPRAGEIEKTFVATFVDPKGGVVEKTYKSRREAEREAGKFREKNMLKLVSSAKGLQKYIDNAGLNEKQFDEWVDGLREDMKKSLKDMDGNPREPTFEELAVKMGAPESLRALGALGKAQGRRGAARRAKEGVGEPITRQETEEEYYKAEMELGEFVTDVEAYRGISKRRKERAEAEVRRLKKKKGPPVPKAGRVGAKEAAAPTAKLDPKVVTFLKKAGVSKAGIGYVVDHTTLGFIRLSKQKYKIVNRKQVPIGKKAPEGAWYYTKDGKTFSNETIKLTNIDKIRVAKTKAAIDAYAAAIKGEKAEAAAPAVTDEARKTVFDALLAALTQHAAEAVDGPIENLHEQVAQDSTLKGQLQKFLVRAGHNKAFVTAFLNLMGKTHPGRTETITAENIVNEYLITEEGKPRRPKVDVPAEERLGAKDEGEAAFNKLLDALYAADDTYVSEWGATVEAAEKLGVERLESVKLGSLGVLEKEGGLNAETAAKLNLAPIKGGFKRGGTRRARVNPYLVRHFDLKGFERPTVLVNVTVGENTVAVPFYLSSGGGRKATVDTGKWYPILGVAKGWYNKGTATQINNFYGIPSLRAVATQLNETFGNLVDPKNPLHESYQELKHEMSDYEVDMSESLISHGIIPTGFKDRDSSTPSIFDNIVRLRELLGGGVAGGLTEAMMGRQIKEPTELSKEQEAALKKAGEVVKREGERLEALDKLVLAVAPEDFKIMWSEKLVNWGLFKKRFIREERTTKDGKVVGWYRRVRLGELSEGGSRKLRMHVQQSKTEVKALSKAEAEKRGLSEGALNLKDADFAKKPATPAQRARAEAREAAREAKMVAVEDADTIIVFKGTHADHEKNIPNLSNWAIAPNGIQVEGYNQTFATIEAAYHAWKSGSYVPGFDKKGMTGEEAFKEAKAKKISPDTSEDADGVPKNFKLMEQLIQHRYDNDPQYKEQLDGAGTIVHPVGDETWSKKFVEILYKVRGDEEFVAEEEVVEEEVVEEEAEAVEGEEEAEAVEGEPEAVEGEPEAVTPKAGKPRLITEIVNGPLAVQGMAVGKEGAIYRPERRAKIDPETKQLSTDIFLAVQAAWASRRRGKFNASYDAATGGLRHDTFFMQSEEGIHPMAVIINRLHDYYMKRRGAVRKAGPSATTEEGKKRLGEPLRRTPTAELTHEQLLTFEMAGVEELMLMYLGDPNDPGGKGAGSYFDVKFMRALVDHMVSSEQIRSGMVDNLLADPEMEGVMRNMGFEIRKGKAKWRGIHRRRADYKPGTFKGELADYEERGLPVLKIGDPVAGRGIPEGADATLVSVRKTAGMPDRAEVRIDGDTVILDMERLHFPDISVEDLLARQDITNEQRNSLRDLINFERNMEVMELKYLGEEYENFFLRQIREGDMTQEEAADLQQDMMKRGPTPYSKAKFTFAAAMAARKLGIFHEEEIEQAKQKTGDVMSTKMNDPRTFGKLFKSSLAGAEFAFFWFSDHLKDYEDLLPLMETLEPTQEEFVPGAKRVVEGDEGAVFWESKLLKDIYAAMGGKPKVPAPKEATRIRTAEGEPDVVVEGEGYEYVDRGERANDDVEVEGKTFKRKAVDEPYNVLWAISKTKASVDPEWVHRPIRVRKVDLALKETPDTPGEEPTYGEEQGWPEKYDPPKQGDSVSVPGEITTTPIFWDSKQTKWLSFDQWRKKYKANPSDTKHVIEGYRASYDKTDKRYVRYTWNAEEKAWFRGKDELTAEQQQELDLLWLDKQEAKHQKLLSADAETTVTMAGLVSLLYEKAGVEKGLGGLDYLAQSNMQERGGPASGMLRNIAFEHLLDRMLRDLGLDPSDYSPSAKILERVKDDKLRKDHPYKAYTKEALVKKLGPIIKAVINAERVDLFDQGPKDVTTVQRSFQPTVTGMGGEGEDVSAEMRGMFPDEESVKPEGEKTEDIAVDTHVNRDFDFKRPSKSKYDLNGALRLLEDENGQDRIDALSEVLAKTEKGFSVRIRDLDKHGFNTDDIRDIRDGIKLLLAGRSGKIRFDEVDAEAVDRWWETMAVRAQQNPEGIKSTFTALLGAAKQALTNREELQFFGSVGTTTNRYMSTVIRAAAATFDHMVKSPSKSREDEPMGPLGGAPLGAEEREWTYNRAPIPDKVLKAIQQARSKNKNLDALKVLQLTLNEIKKAFSRKTVSKLADREQQLMARIFGEYKGPVEEGSRATVGGEPRRMGPRKDYISLINQFIKLLKESPNTTIKQKGSPVGLTKEEWEQNITKENLTLSLEKGTSPTNENRAGHYDPVNHHIVFWKDQIQIGPLLHEVFHGLTRSALSPAGMRSGRRTDFEGAVRIGRLYQQSLDWIKANKDNLTKEQYEAYGWTNQDEFVTEAFVNPNFQRILVKIPHKNSKHMLRALIKAIKRLLGIRNIKDTMLESILMEGVYVMEAEKVWSEMTKQEQEQRWATLPEEWRDPLPPRTGAGILGGAPIPTQKGPFFGVPMEASPSLFAGFMGEDWKEVVEGWSESGVSKTSRLAHAYVDQYLPIEKAVETFMGITGIDKAHEHYDSLHAYVKAYILYGVGHSDMEELELRYFTPIKDALREHGITQEEFGQYLIARAVPGRNIHIDKKMRRGLAQAESEIDKARWRESIKKNKGVGSGTTTKSAMATVKEMEARSDFNSFLKDKRNPLKTFYDMNKQDLDRRVEFGLIPDADRQSMSKASSEFSWKGKSDFTFEDGKDYSYAPLVGFEGETGTIFEQEDILNAIMGGKGVATAGGGQGFSQSTGAHITPAAMGRGGKSANPELVLSQAFHQVSGGMMRAQRNEVAQSFGLLKQTMEEVIAKGTLFGKDVSQTVRDKVKAEHVELFDVKYDDKGEAMELEDVFEEAYVTTEDEERKGALPLKIRRLKPQYATDPRYFTYRVDGKPVIIKLKNNAKGSELAASLNNLRYHGLKSPVMKKLNWGTKFIARMVTTYNASFVVANFLRDYATAYINLTEDDKSKFVGAALNPKNIFHYMRGIWSAEMARAKGKFPENLSSSALKKMSVEEARRDPVTAYLFARAHGAKVGMFRHDTVVDRVRAIEKELSDGKWAKTERGIKKAWKPISDYIEVANVGVENAIRISSFWAAIDAGLTVQQAADVSRNVTVDFNRKGTLSQNMNALYMFFGASMASMRRMHTAIQRRGGYRSRKALILYSQLIGFSAAVNVLNRVFTAWDEDEEGEEPHYDRVNSYLRDTQLNIPIPGIFTDDGKSKSFTIPVTLGWNVFWAIGQNAMDVTVGAVMDEGGQGPTEAVPRLWDVTQNSFNPIGSAGAWWKMFVPTVAMPLVEIGTNRDFMGREIVTEDQKFQLPKPAYTKGKKRTPEWANSLSEALNTAFGGDETVPGNYLAPFGVDPLGKQNDFGRVDLSGPEMDHILGSYFGGPYDMINSFFSGVHSAVSEEEDFKPEVFPVVKRFYRGAPADYSTVKRYYELRERVLQAKNQLGVLQDAKRLEEAREYQKEYNNLLKLEPIRAKSESFLNALNRKKTKINSSKVSASQKKQQLDKMEEDRINNMLRLLAKAKTLDIET